MDDIDFPIPFTRVELAENWFDFNDSTVTAIPVNRIQTQFGGRSTENAYILLYRQRSLAKDPEFKKLGLLPYLKQSVEAQNTLNENERIAYAEAENELEMIFLDQGLINFPERKFVQPTDPIKAGNKLRLKFESTLKNVFQELKLEDPENHILVEMQTLPNNMIQFKRTVDYSSADQKISELNIECWSTWLPFKKDDKIFVEHVSSCIGADAVPIKVNVRNPQSKDTLIITFLNRSLQDFKKQVEEISGIPAEQQLLLLMDGDLPKILNASLEDEAKDIKALGINDNADVMVNLMDPEELRKQRELQAKQKEDKENAANKKEDENIAFGGGENLVSILVERDDEDGVIKYYVDLDWTLAELIENIKKKMGLPVDSERRLKKLNDKNVFYEEDLPLLLRNLNFVEGGIRLRLERGKTPQLGNLSVCVRYQQKDVEPVSIDLIALPGETLFEVKKRACETLGLDEKDHKLYETDWLEDAVQLYGKEDRTLREAGIKQGALIVLRHVSNPIPKEILKINLFETKTGFPTDNDYIGLLQVKEEQTLLELKKMVLQMVNLEGQIDPERLRVREIRKDSSFGKIYKDNNKNLKKLGIETNTSVTFQIREREEILKESTLVLLLRKRIVESQTYTAYEEFIWEASKEPTIEELKKAVIEFKKLEVGLEGVELAKYVSHEFHWLHISKEEIEKGRGSKKGNKGKQQNTNKGNKKGKEGDEAKGNKQQQPQPQTQQAENLRKAPFLLTDGDVISYRIEAENVEKKDDFQTKEDEENFKKYMEAKKKAELEKTSSSNKNRNVGGFQIYTDF